MNHNKNGPLINNQFYDVLHLVTGYIYIYMYI